MGVLIQKIHISQIWQFHDFFLPVESAWLPFFLLTFGCKKFAARDGSFAADKYISHIYEFHDRNCSTKRVGLSSPIFCWRFEVEKFRPGLEVSLQEIYISQRWEFHIKDGSFISKMRVSNTEQPLMGRTIFSVEKIAPRDGSVNTEKYISYKKGVSQQKLFYQPLWLGFIFRLTFRMWNYCTQGCELLCRKHISQWWKFWNNYCSTSLVGLSSPFFCWLFLSRKISSRVGSFIAENIYFMKMRVL